MSGDRGVRSQDRRPRPGRKQHGDGAPHTGSWTVSGSTATTHTGSAPLIGVQNQREGRCPSSRWCPHPHPPGPHRSAHYVKQGGVRTEGGVPGTESKCPRMPTAGFCPSPLSEPEQQVRLYPGHSAAKTEGTFCSVSARVSQTINLRPPPCPASCLLLTEAGDSVSSLLNEKSPPWTEPCTSFQLDSRAWCSTACLAGAGREVPAQGHLAAGHSRSLPPQRNLLWAAASRSPGTTDRNQLTDEVESSC